MKKLLILLFSLLFLSSPSVFADDISDFEIEGISIGDSLLDYMTEDEILKEIERTKDFYLHLNEPNEYAEVYLYKKLKTYDVVSFIVKTSPSNEFITNKNEKYTILAIYGSLDFTGDFDNCFVKRNQIALKLSELFPNSEKRETIYKNSADSSGRSIVDAIYFDYDSGDGFEASCSDLEETLRIKRNWSDVLYVAIKSEEARSWMRNKN